MAMDDDFAEVELAIEKLVPNPQQVGFVLQVQRDVGTNAGMAQKKAVEAE
jgi:hypothetical protein